MLISKSDGDKLINWMNNAKPEEFPDLLHPNALGYAKWEQVLRPHLDATGLPSAPSPVLEVAKTETAAPDELFLIILESVASILS